MKLDNLTNRLSELKIEYVKDEPMRRHTTFKIGGNADVLVKVKSIDELKQVLLLAREFDTPYFVLGKGSNLLVSDKGIEGMVISLAGINDITINGNRVVCGAGASLRSVCVAVQKASLSGLEFAYGIPGTIGGALYMNAGAYGGELSQVLESVTVMDEKGDLYLVPAGDAGFSYRHSIFQENGSIIVKAVFRLEHGDKDAIHIRMQDYMQRRKASQPLELPSAGSTFKRPEGHYAGALIENSGLKGYCVGGAAVSQKHAGFVVNVENASAKDVKTLIREIQDIVYERFGVRLEPEVRIW